MYKTNYKIKINIFLDFYWISWRQLGLCSFWP